MPTLPTLTLTQAQLDRCIVVFGDANGYKIWLHDRLVEALVTHETNRSVVEADVIANALPDPRPAPPTVPGPALPPRTP